MVCQVPCLFSLSVCPLVTSVYCRKWPIQSNCCLGWWIRWTWRTRYLMGFQILHWKRQFFWVGDVMVRPREKVASSDTAFPEITLSNLVIISTTVAYLVICLLLCVIECDKLWGLKKNMISFLIHYIQGFKRVIWDLTLLVSWINI